MSEASETVDVVVVGAGLSGLRAADLLQANRSVVVLEARDRVGGRTHTVPLDGVPCDIGGQWLGVQHDRLAALAAELGIEAVPQYAEGKKVLDLDGRIRTYEGTIPKLNVFQLLALDRVLRRIDRMVAEVSVEDPLAANDAASLDATSVEAWAQAHVGSAAVLALFRAATRVVFGAELHEISMLYFLAYARAGGGLMKLFENRDGTQHAFFPTGAQELSIRLAARLKKPVVLGAPVDRIHHDKNGVTVTAGTRTFHATSCVLAIPPPLWSTIAIDPLLPTLHEQRAQRSPMGGIVKCIASYDRAFWREAGLSGDAVSDTSVVTATMDSTSQGRAALVAFVVGQEARGYGARAPEERQNAVLEALGRFFGPQATKPTGFLEQDWTRERYTRGCPVSVLGAGALSVVAPAMRANVGRLHFAGTETASVGTGYLEGALEAAERVTREISG